ncbi:MAG: hypothetical protein CM15mP65_09950 [Crocinitomicaceae bacterium]|nr:MAG: hypothetical protein CM15mP65_09950 [Crocinitomicaceae bacterium]
MYFKSLEFAYMQVNSNKIQKKENKILIIFIKSKIIDKKPQI